MATHRNAVHEGLLGVLGSKPGKADDGERSVVLKEPEPPGLSQRSVRDPGVSRQPEPCEQALSFGRIHRFPESLKASAIIRVPAGSSDRVDPRQQKLIRLAGGGPVLPVLPAWW